MKKGLEKTIQVRISADAFERLDRYCREEKTTRSKAVRFFIDQMTREKKRGV